MVALFISKAERQNHHPRFYKKAILASLDQGSALLKLERFEEAETVLRRCLEIAQSQFKMFQIQTITSLLATAMSRSGNHAQAEQVLLDNYETWVDDRDESCLAIQSLISFYKDRQNNLEADTWQTRLERIEAGSKNDKGS